MVNTTDNAAKTYTVKIVERGINGRTYSETVSARGAVHAPDAAVEKIYAGRSEGGSRRLTFQREPAWTAGPDGVTKTWGNILRSGLTGGHDVLETVDVTVTEHCES